MSNNEVAVAYQIKAGDVRGYLSLHGSGSFFYVGILIMEFPEPWQAPSEEVIENPLLNEGWISHEARSQTDICYGGDLLELRCSLPQELSIEECLKSLERVIYAWLSSYHDATGSAVTSEIHIEEISNPGKQG